MNTIRIRESAHSDSDEFVVVSGGLDHDGDFRIEVEAGVAYLDKAGCDALVQAINVAQSRCKAEGTAGPQEGTQSASGPSLPGVEADAREAALDLAALHGLEATFRYDKKGGRGNIEPRRLIVGHEGVTVTRDGHKIVTGHDPDRDDVRAYRLDRIVGGVVVEAA